MTVLVNVAGVSKQYAGLHQILLDCSLEIQRGQRLGMVGANGAGKSTLFRLIAGREMPDSGAIWRHPDLSIGYLRQSPSFDAGRTVIECAMEALPAMAALEAEMRRLEHAMGTPEVAADPRKLARTLEAYDDCLSKFDLVGGAGYRNRVESALGQCGFDPQQFEQDVATLSGGQKKLLALAQLYVAQPELLLLDEPDNHLDLAGKRRLEQTIDQYPGTVMIISHDRYLLDVVATHIVEVAGGQATLWHGNYSQFAFEKNVATASQQRAFDVQQREIRRMENAIRRLIVWSKDGELGKTFKRAMAMQKRLDRLERVDAPPGPPRTMKLRLKGSRGSDKAVELNDVRLSFQAPDGSKLPLLKGVNLLVWSGEVVGLVGANGAGKSVLFRIIRGELEADEGRVRIGPSTRPAYYAQEHETLDMSRTVVEELRRVRPMYEGEAYSHLGRFLFGRDAAQKQVAVLSGGEKSRLQFAKLMLTPSNLLLLDEPTNNLDIPSIEVLEQEIDQYEGTVLMISHDRYFLDSVATRLVALEAGRLTSYDGGWEAYQVDAG